MDLQHLSAYKILDTNSRSRAQLPQDLQDLLITLEKTRFQSPNDVKCQHCGGDTIYHGAEGCDSDYIIPSRIVSCISTHDNDDNWFVCLECEAFHLQCSDCPAIQLCRFLGFEGVFYNKTETEWRESWVMRIPTLDSLEKRYPDSCEVKDLMEDIEYRQKNPNPFYTSSYSFGYLDNEEFSRFIEDYPTLSNRIPRYYVGDLNYSYAGERVLSNSYQKLLTGPDGGFVHQWKCPRCQRHYNITDK